MVKMPSYFSYDNDNIWKMSRIEDLSEMERPRQQGIVLHSIMSDIRRLDDVERAVKRKAMRGFIDYDDIPRYISILRDSFFRLPSTIPECVYGSTIAAGS